MSAALPCSNMLNPLQQFQESARRKNSKLEVVSGLPGNTNLRYEFSKTIHSCILVRLNWDNSLSDMQRFPSIQCRSYPAAD